MSRCGPNLERPYVCRHGPCRHGPNLTSSQLPTAPRASAGSCRRAGPPFSLRTHGTGRPLPTATVQLAGGDVSPGARVVRARPTVIVRDCVWVGRPPETLELGHKCGGGLPGCLPPRRTGGARRRNQRWPGACRPPGVPVHTRLFYGCSCVLHLSGDNTGRDRCGVQNPGGPREDRE